MKCILCRNEKLKSDMSDEHVIPDSLGGYYHIYNVCKKCNSYLGKNVDSKLVNHSFSKFFRYKNKIKGKTGKIPNPFEGIHSLSKNENIKTRLEFDDKDTLGTYLLPEVKHIKDELGRKTFTISVDSRDKNELPNIIKKLAKRNNINPESIKIPKSFDIYSKPVDSEVNVRLSIDFKDFKIGLLKIAYEFAVDSISEYYNDKEAIKISKYLLGSPLNSDLFITSGFKDDTVENLLYMLDLKSNKHYLVLLPSKEGLLCIIFLSNELTIIIRLSRKGYISIPIIGVNDIKNKKFEKMDLLELINKVYFSQKLRFCYWFSDKKEAARFTYLEKNQKIEMYMDNKKQQSFFNKKGEILYKNVYEKIDMLKGKSTEYKNENHDLISEIELDEDLYLKEINSDKLYKIVALRIEDKFKKAY